MSSGSGTPGEKLPLLLFKLRHTRLQAQAHTGTGLVCAESLQMSWFVFTSNVLQHKTKSLLTPHLLQDEIIQSQKNLISLWPDLCQTQLQIDGNCFCEFQGRKTIPEAVVMAEVVGCVGDLGGDVGVLSW